MAPNDPMDIAVLCGGISHERDVSLRSGRRLADALRSRGHHVRVVDPDAALLTGLETDRPQLVWPALHGASGEDGALRALLELLELPFVGARSDAARLAWSKPTAKTLVARAGIATADSITLPREALRELGAAGVLDLLVERVGSPVVVKPSQGGSAQGVTIVSDADALPRAMVDAFTYSEVALIERRIDGTEIAVTVIDDGEGPRALPAVEIVPRAGVYSFEARYNAGETRFFAPARLDAAVAESAARAAVEAHRVLGLRHLSRIDLIVDPEGTPFFLEANAMPGLTETSLTPQSIDAAGLDEPEVYESLSRAALV